MKKPIRRDVKGLPAARMHNWHHNSLIGGATMAAKIMGSICNSPTTTPAQKALARDLGETLREFAAHLRVHKLDIDGNLVVGKEFPNKAATIPKWRL